MDAFSYIGQTHLFSRTLDMILISFSNSDDELDPSGRMWLRDSPTDMDGKPRIEVTQAGKPSLDESHTSYVWTTGGLLPPPRPPDFGTQGYRHYMRTGHALTLDVLLNFGSCSIPAEDGDGWYRRSRLNGGTTTYLTA